MGKNVIAIVLLLICVGCASSVTVDPPKGFTVYCEKYPERAECGGNK